MSKKNFNLRGNPHNPIAKGHGGCFATDRISVDGMEVGYMYREKPDNEIDSGWRFLAGDETQDYIDEISNTSVFEVNTIANHDPHIIPFLDAPIGSAFARNEVGRFEEVKI